MSRIDKTFYDTSSSGRISREIQNLRKDIREIEYEKMKGGLDSVSPYAPDRNFYNNQQGVIHHTDEEKSWKKMDSWEEMRQQSLRKLNVL